MKRFFRAFMAMAVLGVFVVSQLGQATAQSNALAITPRKDYTLKPGESVSDTLTVTNTNREVPLTLSLRVVDFTAQDESGTPELLRQNNEKTAWSIRDFIQLPEQIVIEAGGTTRVPVKLEVPTETGAGSYYSAIEYSATSTPEQDRVNISASGVTLVFIKVPGQATQQLDFEQFGAFVPSENGTGGTFAGLFFGERPKVLAYRLKNSGNIAEEPNASIIVRNTGGDAVYMITDANPKNQLALRGQTRRFDACIVPESIERTTDAGDTVDTVVCGDTNFKPGRYTAELSVLYGENGNETREITARATFWYLPWWFIGLVVAGVAIVVGVIVYIVRRFQSYRGRRTRR